MSGANGHDILREGESQVRVEDAGGFRWRYEWREEGVGFAAWRIIARQNDGLKLAMFASHQEGELTPDWIGAPAYLNGAIKADGRCWLKSDAVFLGARGAKQHLAAVKHAWFRCHELLGKKEGAITAEWVLAK